MPDQRQGQAHESFSHLGMGKGNDGDAAIENGCFPIAKCSQMMPAKAGFFRPARANIGQGCIEHAVNVGPAMPPDARRLCGRRFNNA